MDDKAVRSPAKAGAQSLLLVRPPRKALGPGLRRGTAAAAALLLAACSAPEPLPAGPTPLDPIAFFTGVTTGTGTLDTLIASPVPVTVSSLGFREHGGLKLIQRIKEGDKPERVRTWVFKRGSDGLYRGTLTDAEGPVIMDVIGPWANLAYRTPSGLVIEQQLALQPDGRTIRNRLETYKYGVRVATLDETIRRTPAGKPREGPTPSP